nr:hypothetical protein 6 [bacterium]
MVKQFSADEFKRFFVYYQDLAHQQEAVEELWRRMPTDLLRDDALWVKLYRTAPEVEEATGHINQAGVDLIKSFEGLRLEPYYCSGGVLTIGYGCTRDVDQFTVITEEEAEQRLREDLVRFEEAVRRQIKVPLTPNQFAALVSFTFNLGEGALHESTLRRRLNEGQDVNSVISQEFPKWVRAGGQVLYGLQRRRDAEIALAIS